MANGLAIGGDIERALGSVGVPSYVAGRPGVGSEDAFGLALLGAACGAWRCRAERSLGGSLALSPLGV